MKILRATSGKVLAELPKPERSRCLRGGLESVQPLADRLLRWLRHPHSFDQDLSPDAENETMTRETLYEVGVCKTIETRGPLVSERIHLACGPRAA